MSIASSSLSNFFVALLSLLFAAQAFGFFCTKLGIPKVVGEILGGLILGPTFLGHFLPDIYPS